MNSIVKSHPWCEFIPSCPEELKIVTFVLDDVIAAGTVVIAGERGWKNIRPCALDGKRCGFILNLPFEGINKTQCYIRI